MHLHKERSIDVLADSMGMVLHMFALQRVPSRLAELCLRKASFDDGNDEEFRRREAQTKIGSDALEKIWNMSMETATIDDAVIAQLVETTKTSAALQIPCIHSQLCFAFSLRLLFDKRSTEALDICEHWLEDLEKTRQFHPEEPFVWYKIGVSACRALACAILSQGIKARDFLRTAQQELEMYDLPGLRAYISCIGLLAAGALCAKRQNVANECRNHGTTCFWTNPNFWKQSAVAHILRCQSYLEPASPTQNGMLGASAHGGNRLQKRRFSNVFEDLEVCDRETFLNDSELMHLIMNQYTSLVAALTRMRPFSNVEQTKSQCVFAELWEHIHSWKSELDKVIVFVPGQKQQF
jgi:hypothetical protein